MSSVVVDVDNEVHGNVMVIIVLPIVMIGHGY